MNSFRTLLAIHDPVLRQHLKSALVRAGASVAETASPDRALAEASARLPELVVMEDSLGEGSPGELRRALRALPGAAQLPILALVGHGARGAADGAPGDDATDLVSKPVDFERFEQRIRFLARTIVAARDLASARDGLLAYVQRLEQAHLQAGLGQWECDPASDEVAFTQGAAALFGLDAAPTSLEELVSTVVHPDDRAKFLEALRAMAAGSDTPHVEHRCADAARTLRHFPVRNRARSASEPALSLVVQDVTPQRLAEERMRRMALYDSVTGLPGRSIFVSRLERALGRFRGEDGRVALLLLDLRAFAALNARHGESFGDEALRAIAGRLLHSLRASDSISRIQGAQHGIARFGGDEFAIVLTGIRGAEDAALCAKRLTEVVSAPLELPGVRGAITLDVSVGIAVAPRDGATVPELLESVRRAQLAAKKSPSRYRFPDGSRNAREDRAATILADLPHVAERGELSVLFQPRIELAGRRIAGAEALVRWAHPRLGEIAPKDFIAIAEREGLIDSIGSWVLSTAASAAASWASGRVSVNVSRSQLLSGDFARTVFRAMIESRIRPDQLELEVTESLMYESDSCLEALRELAAVGVTLALDDFGSGYSSLSALVRFPVQVIKIDRSIVKDMDENPNAERVVRGIVRVGHDLGMRVVAEGVDRDGQVPLLVEAGCDEAQGFLFAEPLSQAEYTAFVASWDPSAAGLARTTRGDAEPPTE